LKVRESDFTGRRIITSSGLNPEYMVWVVFGGELYELWQGIDAIEVVLHVT
jgi:hypothetical protein